MLPVAPEPVLVGTDEAFGRIYKYFPPRGLASQKQ